MKTHLAFRKLAICLIVASVAALAFAGCKSADTESGKKEAPAKSEHPEHPK